MKLRENEVTNHNLFYLQLYIIYIYIFCIFLHYKKRGFRPRLKNVAIDPKNAAIGYSRVYKRGLNTAAIVV